MHKQTAQWLGGIVLAWFGLSPAWSAGPSVFETVKVSERVYALVGDLGQRSPTNLGNNMTGGFVLADDGVVVIDAGGSKAGAQAIVAAVKQITDKPIKWVVNTGGQDHRWLGNDHFQREVGAQVVASEAGLQDIKTRTHQQVEMARKNVAASFEGTLPSLPTEIFGRKHRLPVKGVQIELLDVGGAHTRGDLVVWLPETQTAFTGDIVFAERLLGIQPSLALKWMHALTFVRDDLKPVVVIPGHGRPTSLDKAMKDSLGYLTLLHDGAVQAFKNGAFDPVEAAAAIDQSPFSYLVNFDDARFRSSNAIRMAEEVFKRQP